jgi:hypothetical protein
VLGKLRKIKTATNYLAFQVRYQNKN